MIYHMASMFETFDTSYGGRTGIGHRRTSMLLPLATPSVSGCVLAHCSHIANSSLSSLDLLSGRGSPEKILSSWHDPHNQTLGILGTLLSSCGSCSSVAFITDPFATVEMVRKTYPT